MRFNDLPITMRFNDLPTEEKNFLLCEQSKGKEIKYINNKWVAVEHVITEEEKKQARIGEIRLRLNELTQDFVQADLGADFGEITLEDNTTIKVIDQRKTEFKTLHNELRGLLGKEPRQYQE